MMQLMFITIRYFLVLMVLFLSACVKPAYIIDTEKADPSITKCLQFFSQFDAVVNHESVEDVQASRVDGLPFLRANRFLASFSDNEMDDAQFAAWLTRMNTLAVETYNIEWKNLSDQGKRSVLGESFGSVAEELSYCSKVLINHLKAMPDSKAHLKESVAVPDDYQLWKRAAGLYPISAWGFLLGIQDWHEDTRQVFAQPLKALPVTGQLYRYAPQQRESRPLAPLQLDVLGIPVLSLQAQNQLFKKFAPILEVDVGQVDDEVGRVRQQSGVYIDVADTVAYQKLSYTRFQGKILPQLNYIFWFPSRPKTSAFDLLGGNVDSIMWRVTLTQDGQPLLYDTIHSCGCYHMFFPSNRLEQLAQNDMLDEGALVPQVAPTLEAGKAITIRIEQGSHYIQKVYLSDSSSHVDRPYSMLDYNDLRSLPSGEGGFHSVFNNDAIMPNTERSEAYIFWPMGIAKPGSMRQWGHHATAFVGHRHFDDVNLLERYFTFKK